MKISYFFLLISIFEKSEAITGVIWNKIDQDFIPLFSVDSFAAKRDEYNRKFRKVERHNFHGEKIKISYFQESNIVSFIDNDTKITGVCGELWNILADYLNFTLVPIKSESKNFGLDVGNGSYDGILGLIQRNLTQIIPRSGVIGDQLNLLDFTMPLWSIRYHLYIKPEWKHDEAWMFHIFSYKIWFLYFLLLFILSIGGYICEKESMRARNGKVNYGIQDYIFYTIAIASSQGSVPLDFHNKSKIIYLCTSMFSWILMIAFSSHAIILMMNKKYVLPFTGLRSLIRDSKYEVIVFSGSMMRQEFEETFTRFMKHSRDYNRISYAPNTFEIYEKVCFDNKKKLAVFEADDRHKAIGRNICRLIPTKTGYYETWIASAVKKGFHYKRSFDIGILKLSEHGIIDGLKDRWLNFKYEEPHQIPFQTIGISQVYLIFVVLFIGFTSSVFILFVENLVFYKLYPFRYRSRSDKKKSRIIDNLRIMKYNKSHAFLTLNDKIKL